MTTQKVKLCFVCIATLACCISAARATLVLVYDHENASPFPSNFWTAAPMTDRNLDSNETAWLISVKHLIASGDDKLLAWNGNGGDFTYPLTDTMSTVRLLGGWANTSGVPRGCLVAGHLYPNCTPPHCCQKEPGGPRAQCCNPVSWSDVVWKNGLGLGFRWQSLYDRLDGIVNNSIKPIIVLDNVDYAFVKHATVGKYGQNRAPDNITLYASSFIKPLVTKLVARYGLLTVLKNFTFRVGTEPNTSPGHWDDGVEKYVDMYVAVEAAIQSVLEGRGRVGPGNFCPFYEPGRGCNRTNGGLGTTVVPIVQGIVARSNLSFISGSFYGGASGCGKPGKTCGYDPSLADLASQGLRYIRKVAGPRFSEVPLTFMEFGTLGNAHGRISPEPGAFGAAWTVHASARAAAQGISRAFHWKIFDSIGTRGRSLYYSSAWVTAAARHVFGSSGRIVVLNLTSAIQSPRASTSQSSGAVEVAGIGGPMERTQSGAGFGALVAFFSSDKKCTDNASAVVQFACPAPGGCSHSPSAVSVRVMNKSTSTFDQLHTDAVKFGWAAHNDSEVYPINVMLNRAGQEALRNNSIAQRYLAIQTRSFSPLSANDNPGVTVTCDSNGSACQLNIMYVTPPSVFAIQVVWKV